MQQTDYGYRNPLGIPGLIYDLSDKRIVTRQVDDGEALKPGMGVVVGAETGSTVMAPTSSSEAADFEGVFVQGSLQMEQDKDGIAETEGGESIGVMNKGRIWVYVVDTATTDYKTEVALIVSGDNIGKFTSSDDSNETTITLTDVIFTGKVDDEYGIAVIEIM